MSSDERFGKKANNIPGDPNHVTESPESRKHRRLLTTLLQETGDQVTEMTTIDPGTGEILQLTKAQVLNEMVWSLLLNLEVKFPTGNVAKFKPTEWFEAVKFLFHQVDGPTPVSRGITLNQQFNLNNWVESRQSRLTDLLEGLPDEEILSLPVPQIQESVEASAGDLQAYEDLENAEAESLEPVIGTIFERGSE